MKKQTKTPQTSTSYNDAVALAYRRILKQAKRLLSCVEQDELRFILEREEHATPEAGVIVHEIVSPILYLRLECHSDSRMAIHFGIEQVNDVGQLSGLTSKFLRTLFTYTSKEMTAVNIESCVRTDWFINSCSAMYEYIELRNKYHTFKQISYKLSAAQKKQMLSVA